MTARTIGTVIIVAAIGAACSDTTAVDTAPQFSGTASGYPALVTLEEGDQTQLTPPPWVTGAGTTNEADIEWSSDDPEVVTVDGDGNVTAVNEGFTYVRAQRGLALGMIAVYVSPTSATGPASGRPSIVVSPAADTLDAIGLATKLSATVRDAQGNVTEWARTWKSLKTTVATVSTNGTVTAKGIGTASIVVTAPCCGIADTALIVVRSVTVGSVQVTPTSASLAAGSSISLAATAKDAGGKVIPGAVVTWTSSASAIATVSSNGTVTGVKAGSATITAKAGTKTATAAITVTATSTPPPAPPPPAPPPPSQSPGLRFGDNFDTGKKLTLNGYKWNATPVNVTVSRDIAYNGSYSLKFHFPGKPNLCDDASAEQRLGFGERFTEIWIEYYLYLPDGSEGLGSKFQHREPTCTSNGDVNGTISNNKFFAMWATSYTSHDVAVVFEYRAMTSGTPGDSYLYGMHGTDTRPTGQYGSDPWSPSFSNATRGRWTQIRIHARVASSKAARDGGYQMWANGQLVIDQMDRDLAPNPGGNAFFENMYLFGWQNSGFDQDTNVYVDDFKIFGSSPGW